MERMYEEELRIQRRDKAKLRQELEDLKAEVVKLNAQIASGQQ